MSWHYSQGQEEDFSVAKYLDGLRSARSRSNGTHEKSSFNDSEMDSLKSSQSGTTSVPSTADPGEGSSMLSAEGSPARTSVVQVKVRDLPEPVAAFGSSICESLKRLCLVLSSRKTVRCCVPVDLAPSSKDLPAWGMTFDGACWELGTSVRIIGGTECGSLLDTSMIKHKWRKNMWPTPCASDGSGSGLLGQRSDRDGPPTNLKGYLSMNEKWLYPPVAVVEWLIGWPLGWTDLKPLATDKFRSWLQQHGIC